jgi:hypothetical protein
VARRKVRLADNIARIVEIDDAATVGATLAADLKDTDGKTIATPASMKTWLGIKDPVAATAATIRMATPASSSAQGSAGQMCYDTGYLYICTASNTWRRIAHSSF